MIRVNWSRFLLLFLLFQSAIFLTGCSAAWLGAVSAILPALSGAVSAALAFILSLEGKTVSPAVVATIQKIVADIQGQITEVQTLIADYKNAASAGTLAQINAVFQGISADLASILKDFNVTDTATVSKFTALVGLAIAAAQAIIGLLPLVTAAISSGASKEVLAAQDKEAAVHIQGAHKSLQSAYVTIRTTPSDSADVNAALATLPTSLP